MEFRRNLSIVFTFFGKSAEVENQHVLLLLNLMKSNKHYGPGVKHWIKIMEFLQTSRPTFSLVPASNFGSWSKFKKMLLQNWRLSDGDLTAVRWLSDDGIPYNIYNISLKEYGGFPVNYTALFYECCRQNPIYISNILQGSLCYIGKIFNCYGENL